MFFLVFGQANRFIALTEGLRVLRSHRVVARSGAPTAHNLSLGMHQVAAMSARPFQRRFEATTDMTSADRLTRVRLGAARELLEIHGFRLIRPRRGRGARNRNNHAASYPDRNLNCPRRA
ncbi:hypothetical protein BN2476_570015 [Paraburkholderia piptadeniae]|uniref:Uncharacterized protein n=1 Tax=Paraburkholderia piptadeniae TaxID=1701573 RepID=A0A1N7SJB9_9BURK|nr:hypothetical protein BN2476_570015 [Paraburkholderia piptadeniae]